jgi:hypothetical protein
MTLPNEAVTILNDETVQQKITATLQLIDGTFKNLLQDGLTAPVKDQVYMNRHILLNVVESCYCDLQRLTHFRKIEPDHHKRAAFLIKWIMLLRPVQIHAKTVDPGKECLLINEILAVSVGVTVILRIADVLQVFQGESNYIKNFIYLLHYHSCWSPEQLASEMYLFEQSCRNYIRHEPQG